MLVSYRDYGRYDCRAFQNDHRFEHILPRIFRIVLRTFQIIQFS